MATFGFAAGFAVRPFGALFFGRLGDLIGRKYTFLVTMTLMGLATFVVGLLPNYNTIGILAPILLVIMLANTRNVSHLGRELNRLDAKQTRYWKNSGVSTNLTASPKP